MVRATAEPNDFDCIVVLHAEVHYDSLRPDQLTVADARLARVGMLAISSLHEKDRGRSPDTSTFFHATAMARLLVWSRCHYDDKPQTA